MISTFGIESDEDGRFAIPMAELAARLGVNKRTLQHYATIGRLPTVWVGNKQVVLVGVVRRLLAGELQLVDR